MNKEGILIVGAGGHAKVVLSTALANAEKIIGFLDDDPALLHTRVDGHAVIGTTSVLSSEDINGAIFGVGDNRTRKLIAERYLDSFILWKTFVHPSAYVHPSAKLGVGTVVFAGAVIQPDAKIGNHCIINTGVTVDHDCVVNDYAHLAPGVHLAGNVNIGEGAFLGIGSVVIPGITIGDWVTVGAGGVVVNAIGAKKMVMGIPAKERVT